jgi:hypothetical protein
MRRLYQYWRNIAVRQRRKLMGIIPKSVEISYDWQ